MARVPGNAIATLVVEDLRDHARAINAKGLWKRLQSLAAVKTWMQSPQHRQFQENQAEIERLIGAKFGVVVDELLGDAVVLAISASEDKNPERARGLLLTRVRNPRLLTQVLDALNRAEQDAGDLVRLESTTFLDVAYSVRRFRPGLKPDELYAILGNDLFVWTNSDDLLRGAIEKHLGRDKSSLARSADFQEVRAKLDGANLATLFLNPKGLEALQGSSKEAKPNAVDDPIELSLRRVLSVTRYLGAGLGWRQGPRFELVQTFDAELVNPSWKAWATKAQKVDDLVQRVPGSALAFGVSKVDFVALDQILEGILPERDRPNLDHLKVMLEGLLLGLNLEKDVLPNLGPGLTAVLQKPKPRSGDWPISFSLQIGPREGVSQAVGNALRTVMAMASLDPKNAGSRLHSENQAGSNRRMTTWTKGDRSLNYGLTETTLAVGTSVDDVNELLTSSLQGDEGSEFARIQREFLPNSALYVFADFDRLTQVIEPLRDVLARKIAERKSGTPDEAKNDLDQAIAMMRLFRGLYGGLVVDPDLRSVSLVIGAIEPEVTSSR